jgi:hypothetical protein
MDLSTQMRADGVRVLNRPLAHTMAIRPVYKKTRWQTSGATLRQLALLFLPSQVWQQGIAQLVHRRAPGGPNPAGSVRP